MAIGQINDGEVGSSVRGKLNSVIDFTNKQDNVVYVGTKSDLPAPSGGVITLSANTTYFIFGDIDLTGDRLLGSADTCILGTSSETSSLTSTGLTGNALLTTEFVTPIRHITFLNCETGVSINVGDTAVTPPSLDWYGVNFNGCGTSVVCGNIDNFVFNVGAILNGGSFRFEGDAGSIVINSSIFVSDGAAENLIDVTSTANISRRFRATYSAFVVVGSSVGIDFDVLATVSNEGYILDTCNFSGGGTYLSGVDASDNKALFVNNVGVDNSADISQYYMNGNATATTIGATGTPVKVAGTTTSSPVTSKFTNTDNRATYAGALTKFFKVSATLSVVSGNNNQIGVYIAKNGSVLNESEVYGTTGGTGRAENIVVQTLVQLKAGDYIEIFVENNTTTNNITVSDLNLVIE